MGDQEHAGPGEVIARPPTVWIAPVGTPFPDIETPPTEFPPEWELFYPSVPNYPPRDP